MNVNEQLETLGTAWGEFKASNTDWRAKIDRDLDALGKDLADVQLNGGRPSGQGAGGERAAYTPALGQAMLKAFRGDDREIKAMSAGNDAEGGFLVVPQMDNQIRLIRERVSPLSTMAREISLTEGGEALLPRVNGTLSTGWVGENDTRAVTDSLPLGLDRVVLHEVYAMPQVTQKLLDISTYDVGALLVDQIGHGLAAAEDLALHSGNGVGRPFGIGSYSTAATADATRTWGVIQHTPTGGSGAWHTNQTDPLFDLVAALAPQYRANARFMMSRATLATIRKMREGSTTGAYLFQPGLMAGEPDRVLGYPVVVSENVPTIAANSLSIWFGDFAQAYTIVRMPGLRLLRDPYSTKGQVAFYAYARVGGSLTNSDAVKVMKFAAA